MYIVRAPVSTYFKETTLSFCSFPDVETPLHDTKLLVIELHLLYDIINFFFD